MYLFAIAPFFLIMVASFWLSFSVWYFGDKNSQSLFVLELKHFLFIFLLWLLVYYANGLFEAENYRATRIMLARLVLSACLSGTVAVLYFYAQPSLSLTPRRFLLLVLVVNFCACAIWALILRKFLSKFVKQRVYVYSGGNLLPELIRELEEMRHAGIIFSGYVSLGEIRHNFFAGPGEVRIVLPQKDAMDEELVNKIFQLRTFGIMFYSLEQIYEDIFRRIRLSVVNQLWFLENINLNSQAFYLLVKRVVDLVFGFLGFCLFIVTYPLFFLLIKFSSPGEVIFKQTRTGLRDKEFILYKYRTMSGAVQNTWTAQLDPRITRIGKFLRATRLDELPQSINLLLGNMSLVGPRPEQTSIVKSLEQEIPFFSERHQVKPGLTGWAQLHIYASSLEDTKKKLEYDLYYIKYRSLWFDLEIILKTLYHVLSGQGR